MSSFDHKTQLQNEINHYSHKINKYLTKYETLLNEINGGADVEPPKTPNQPIKKVTPDAPTKKKSESDETDIQKAVRLDFDLPDENAMVTPTKKKKDTEAPGAPLKLKRSNSSENNDYFNNFSSLLFLM